MDLDVLFLGTAGSAPTARRGLPALLVRRGGDRLLFDCGEGTQRQLVRSAGLAEIQDVFISHFHADHVLGLPGLLKTWSLHGREAPLAVHGPAGLVRLFAAFRPLVGKTTFEIELIELEPNSSLQRDGYSVAAFEVAHGAVSLGYALVEDDRPGRFDEERARALGVTPGPDYGRLQDGHAVSRPGVRVEPEQVLGDPRRGRKVVVAGDTEPCEMTRAVAWRGDLLVHEATFTQADVARAVETRHATALGAAELARGAEVELLALTHVSPRYPTRELRDEARAVFEHTIVPEDFDRVEIPLPERGPPVHHRAREQLGAPA